MTISVSRWSKWAAVGAFAVAALGFGAAANAGVSWSVGINAPGISVGVANPRVYYPPAYYPPAYYAPPAVYAPPPVYYRPAPPVYYRPPAVVYRPPLRYYAPAPVYYAPSGYYRGHGHGGRHGWR